jgi:phenylalanyl-tRNA synthetase beta chain
VHEEIDLIEEVARIYGYNNIERPLPKATSPQIPHDPAYLFETELRRRLVALGLQEWITCDLISPKLADLVPEIVLSRSHLLQTLHSKSEEYSVLRPSLLPGLLQVVRKNFDQKNQTLRAFELGRIHFLQEQKPVEFPMIALLLTGKEAPHHWDRKPNEADFFDLKGLLENLLDGIRVPSYTFAPSKHPSFHPTQQADLFLNSLFVGTLGQLHPTLLAKLDIKEPVYYAELNAHSIQTHRAPPPHMKPLPQFPSSERDWTLPLNPTTPLATLFEAIRSLHLPLLEHVSLLDLFQTPEKKNATFRFVYRDPSKTLSFEEVEAAHAHLMSSVTSKL